MGSIRHLGNVIGGLEEALERSGGVQDAEDKTKKLVWPAIESWSHERSKDDLWELVDRQVTETLRPRDERYESYADWYNRTSSLWLTFASVRHLLVKWADFTPMSASCAQTKIAMHHPVTESQVCATDVQQEFERLGRGQDADFAKKNIALPQAINPKRLQVQFKVRQSPPMYTTHFYTDLHCPIGYFQAQEFEAPVSKAAKTTYEFGVHKLALPVTWKSEFVPELFVTAEDTVENKRYSRNGLAAYQIYAMMREALYRAVPLVVYDAPTGRKPLRKP